MHGFCGGECGCQQFVMSAVWAASELTKPQPAHTHTHTCTGHTLQPAHLIRKRRKERHRDMFPSARQMVFVRQPSDVDLGESPSQSHTYTLRHMHIYTHTNTHIRSHVNICGDSNHRQSSRSEPHLLLDLPHTHMQSFWTLGPNQTWPSLSSSYSHRNTHTHYKYELIYAQKHTDRLTTKEQPAHDGNRQQSVTAGWSCARSVSTPETVEHTPQLINIHTCKTHTKNWKIGHGLQNVTLRFLDRIRCLPGFCNWPHSALSSFLCTWL